ncbi:MAG: dihydrolipoyl dehydrogenase, partial [Enterobacterales bacterium]|nr:dihydrolipoyl dehydrogenase [Enterobacterales bacterium]
LAHKASAQGEVVAENIAGSAAGKKVPFNPTAIAAVCFTEPEVVSVGLSPAEAEAAGYNITIGKFPFAAIGKAMTQEAGKDGGFVRIVAREENHHIIGIQAVGAHVAELSNQFALAIEMGACLEDFAGTIHVHPTLGEASMEAALAGLGHAIHI